MHTHSEVLMKPDRTAALRHECSIEIAALREHVWHEITQRGAVQPFYFNSLVDGRLQEGQPLRYLSPDLKHVFIRGEVLEVVPQERYAHTFAFSDAKERPSRVLFTFERLSAGTRLTVEHDGFEGASTTWKRTKQGWPSILGNLKAYLETGKLPFKTRFQHFMMRLFLPLMPKA